LVSAPSLAAFSARSQQQRLYRLVDSQGSAHPVLDDHYDSLEAAWADAESWWHQQGESLGGPVPIGVEVSTASGGWRTLRHPGR
jgi:hypothetical protein